MSITVTCYASKVSTSQSEREITAGRWMNVSDCVLDVIKNRDDSLNITEIDVLEKMEALQNTVRGDNS